MGKALKADVVLLKMRQGWRGKIAELMVRRNQKEGIKLDIRIMLLGCPGSGKSTLVPYFFFNYNEFL
jgi:polynucleotide 5'-kinase involved in rRNA processing